MGFNFRWFKARGDLDPLWHENFEGSSMFGIPPPIPWHWLVSAAWWHTDVRREYLLSSSQWLGRSSCCVIPLSWRFSHLRRPPRPSVCHFASFPAKTWLLSSLFGVCYSVRWWRLRRRKKVIFRPSRTSLFIDVGEMPALAAIFVSDRLGFLLIFILVFLTTSWARADRGRPLLGASSTLPFRQNFF